MVTDVMSIGVIRVLQIHVGQQPLECITEFQYLGSYISTVTDPETDIRARLGKAELVYQRLSPIWSRLSISNTVNFRLYTSVALSTAINACETRNRQHKSVTLLDVFQRQCIRKNTGNIMD